MSAINHGPVYIMQASHLSEYDYNRGALLAAAHLLADPDTRLHKSAGTIALFDVPVNECHRSTS